MLLVNVVLLHRQRKPSLRWLVGVVQQPGPTEFAAGEHVVFPDDS
jgi:hypothetical protein